MSNARLSPIQVAAWARAEHRKRQDSGSTDSILLPAGAIQPFARRMLAQGITDIRQVLLIDTEDWDLDSYEHQIWRDASQLGCSISRLYVTPHMGFASALLRKQLVRDAEAGLVARCVPLSQLPAETQSISLRETWTLDHTTIVTRISAESQADAARLWSVSERTADLEAADRQWALLWESATPSLSAAPNLEEPLVASADLIHEVAQVLCTSNHVDPHGCSWYHSAWQYMRILDLVSTPSWHSAFYERELQNCFMERPNATVLISGTADYSVLAFVIAAARAVDAHPAVHVIDLCDTPLFACLWYAKRTGIRIYTARESIFNISTLSPDSVDVVCTDAFLTRFPPAEARNVVTHWARLLRSGGHVVTTIRCHSKAQSLRNEEHAVQQFRVRAQDRARGWSPFLKRTPIEIAELAETYARKMKSNDLSETDDETTLLTSFGFVSQFSELVSVPGELYPTVYFRTHATLAKQGEATNV